MITGLISSEGGKHGNKRNTGSVLFNKFGEGANNKGS